MDWQDESALGGVVAALPHMAFHLGAIRQLLRLNYEEHVSTFWGTLLMRRSPGEYSRGSEVKPR
jgi:hypothetical protein